MRARLTVTILAKLLTAVTLVSVVLSGASCGGGSHSTPSTTEVLPPPPTIPAPAPGRAADFGVDGDGIFLNPRLDTAAADRQLAAAAAVGLGLVRAAPLWEFTEPQRPRDGRHHYAWRFDDFIASHLSAHGFRWVALLAFTPGWASETPNRLHGAPRSTADFAAYAAAVARRYRGEIVAFEIWNEENSPQFWRPVPNPRRYAQLYLAARAAIHRADPGVPVLVGGLANGDGSQFLSDLINDGLRGHVDGVAVHPYGRDPAAVTARVRAYRLQLRSLGAADVPLYVTEYGWATRPVGGFTWASQNRQGPFIEEVAHELLGSDCDVRSVIFYAWTTPERDPASADSWYGVAAYDGAPTPATVAVARATRALMTPSATRPRLCDAAR